MDFMNLNQSAHGDREFGFIATRMGLAPQDRRRPLERPAVVRRDRRVGARGLRLARAAAALGRAVRRQHAPGRSHGGRQGRGADSARRRGERLRRRRARAAPSRRSRTPKSTSSSREYEEQYDLAPALRAGGERREALRDAARIEAGLRSFLEAGGFRAFTDTFEDLDGLPQLPGIAVQRLMADGYGFGAEGDWKTAALVRAAKVMSAGLARRHLVHGGLHLRPRAGGGRVLGAHMLEVCPSIAAARPSCEIHPLSIGGTGGPGPARLHCRARPGGQRGARRSRRPLPAAR